MPCLKGEYAEARMGRNKQVWNKGTLGFNSRDCGNAVGNAVKRKPHSIVHCMIVCDNLLPNNGTAAGQIHSSGGATQS